MECSQCFGKKKCEWGAWTKSNAPLNYDEHGKYHLSTSPTIFVFMEDNDDAYFYGPHMSIPVKKGSLIRFNGAFFS